MLSDCRLVVRPLYMFWSKYIIVRLRWCDPFVKRFCGVLLFPAFFIWSSTINNFFCIWCYPIVHIIPPPVLKLNMRVQYCSLIIIRLRFTINSNNSGRLWLNYLVFKNTEYKPSFVTLSWSRNLYWSRVFEWEIQVSHNDIKTTTNRLVQLQLI